MSLTKYEEIKCFNTAASQNGDKLNKEINVSLKWFLKLTFIYLKIQALNHCYILEVQALNLYLH